MKAGRFLRVSLAFIVMVFTLCTPVPAAASIEDPQWSLIGAPLGDTSLRDMVVDPLDGTLWYVGSFNNGLYITRDGGETWELHLGGNVGTITLDPANHNMVYASTFSDLYRSDDQGQTWSLLYSFPNPIPGSPLDASTFIDSMLVSTVDGTIVVGLTSVFHSARIYTSSDGGVTWEISYEAEDNGWHFWDLAEIPSNGYWFFCTEDPSHEVNSVVMRSTNRGQTWEEMVPLRGIPTAGHGLNLDVHPVTETVYFLTESAVLFSSQDFGDSWPDLRFLDFGIVLLIDKNQPDRFFGGEIVRGLKRGGVFYSEDSGTIFDYLGPLDTTIGSLALNGDSKRLYAVAVGEGIYTLSLDSDDVLEATIDIKPGSDSNCFPVNGHGVIPVAILGDGNFYVEQIDLNSLSFAGLAVRGKGQKGPMCEMEHSNDDEYPDLVCHFEDDTTSWAPGDGEATLTGTLLDGTPFEGTDSICVVP
jgi:photosystem II stability/assembly factor-like uncharacterized protein